MVTRRSNDGIVYGVAARWLVASACAGLASADCSRWSNGPSRVRCACGGSAIVVAAVGDAVRMIAVVVAGGDGGVGVVVAVEDDDDCGTGEWCL